MTSQRKNQLFAMFDKVKPYVLTALFVSIPLLPKITTILLILYFVLSIPGLQKRHFLNLFEQQSLRYFMIVYAFLLVGVTYSIDAGTGLAKIQTQLSFFIVPFFMGGTKLGIDHRNRCLKAYVLGVLLTVLLCFGNVVHRFMTNGEFYVLDEFSREQTIFFYKEFSRFLDLHPTYFSVYIGAALFCLLVISFNDKRKWNIFKIFLKGLFFIALFLTSSKGGILSFVLVYVFFVLFEAIKSKKVLDLYVLGVMFLGIIVMFVVNPMLYKRSAQLISTVDKGVLSSEQLNESSSIRFNLWSLSLEAYTHSPIWGFGTGSVYKTIDDICLDSYSFSNCESLRLKNSHNQYLNFMVSNGILVLIPFLIALVLAFRSAIRNKDQVFVLFMAFMTLNFFFESLLQRERGVVFFMLFIVLFMTTHRNSFNDQIKKI
jgi:hypothetical protein